jgi:hypothetical protein
VTKRSWSCGLLFSPFFPAAVRGDAELAHRLEVAQVAEAESRAQKASAEAEKASAEAQLTVSLVNEVQHMSLKEKLDTLGGLKLVTGPSFQGGGHNTPAGTNSHSEKSLVRPSAAKAGGGTSLPDKPPAGGGALSSKSGSSSWCAYPHIAYELWLILPFPM